MVLVVGLVLGVVALGGDDDAVAVDQDRVAELEQLEAERNATQTAELTELGTRAQQSLQPIAAAFMLPEEERTVVLEDLVQLNDWQLTLDELKAELAEPPSGSTELNIARTAIGSAVNTFSLALTSHEAILAAEEEKRALLRDLADGLRDEAMSTWGVAANQIDIVNVDAGNGHVHLDLSGTDADAFDHDH